jgi:hypothetical protein
MKLTRNRLLIRIRLGLSWIAMVCAWAGMAQTVTTTTVQGTVYLANGAPASGTLTLSWPAFTTSNGLAVASDTLFAAIAANGYVSVNLAPNLGSTPAGLFYTAVYNLSDGSTSTEYWTVPATSPATIAQVRAQVMPAAQAVQAVSKAYVDQSIQSLAQGTLASVGGTLSGPLYLNGDPTQTLQAADKHYVDASFSAAMPLAGGAATGAITATQIGAAYQVDRFAGADFGAKVQACLAAISSVNGGTCDARNFSGTLAMASNLTIATANANILLPCATIATANQIIVAPGLRNVALHGCALRGTSAASGSQGGTVLLYSGSGAAVQVGDTTYASDTSGFLLDNVAINTTGTSNSTAQAFGAYRTQELDIERVYLLGNSNQTGITLDGTGNYTGGTFYDDQMDGFGTAVNAIGHQVANPATTDWVNASTFLRLHIDCPTSGGNPVSGTIGINLQQGDGNTFTGGDVEGCATALHLGTNAQNNTIVGLRNENSTYQVVADSGSAYNSWFAGGAMLTGKLTDNGTRNSFADAFHRTLNSMNGDWYGSQQDATLTNHFRLGIGSGNERGLLDRYQTDYGYRWTMGLSDAIGGEQFYQLLDELNSVYRISIGQYNNGQSNTNNQTMINAAGTGAVIFNGSNNSGTGGVVFGSGGPSETTVATINNQGNAQFNGTLQVGGAAQSAGTMTIRNNADAEVDYYLWPGLTASQKGSFTYKDWNGNSQWYLVKDASNNWAVSSAAGGLDSFKAYQSTNSGDTYIDAANATGAVRVNYESGSGTAFNVYGGNSGTLYAGFTGAAFIRFPGLAAGIGHNCVQIDNSGYLSNTGSACGTGSGSGTVNSGVTGQIAYYAANGVAVSGVSTVPVSAGGTGATTPAAALIALGGASLGATGTQAFAGRVTGNQVGASFEADQFSGSDAGAQVNVCIAAAIAAGGGTCDARALSGTQVINEEIDLGSETQAASGTTSVTLLLPTSAVWEFNITNGTSCGIKQFSNNNLVGESSTGGAVRMILAPYNTSTNMDSLYCTDPSPTSGGNYVHAQGFAAFTSYGGTGTGTFANGALHVQHMFDESSFSYIMGGGSSTSPYGWQIDDTCCGDSFDHVQGLMRIGTEDIVTGVSTTSGSAIVNYSGTTAKTPSALVGKSIYSFDNQNLATGANAANETIPAGATVTAATTTTLTLSQAAVNTTSGNILEIDPGSTRGGATTSTFSDITANDPPAGMPNILIGGASSNLDFTNLYMEQDSDPDNTTPMAYVGSKTMGVFLQGTTCADNGETTKPCIFSASQAWGYDALAGHGGSVDKLYGVTIPAQNGFQGAPYQTGTTNALTKAVFTPSSTGWYRVLDTSRLFQQPAVLGGTMEVSQFQGSDALWDFTDGTYGQHSSLSVRRALYQYSSWGSVTKIEVSKNGLDQYVDLYVSSTSSFPVTITFSGASIPSGAIVAAPSAGATPPADSNAAIIDLTQLPQSTPRATTESEVAVGSPLMAQSSDGSDGIEIYAENSTGGSYVQQTGGGSLWINNPYTATFVQTGGYQNVVFNNNGKTQFNYNVGFGGNSSPTWMLSGLSNDWGVDANGMTHRAGASPTASAGTVTGTNEGGAVSGLSTATSLTLTFANGGWNSWASCVATPGASLSAAPYVSSISNAAVTFSFPSLTGDLYYHCDGN